MACPYFVNDNDDDDVSTIDDGSTLSEDLYKERLAGYDMARVSKSLLDSAFDAVVVCTMDGTMVHVNASTLTMFGYQNNEELIGTNCARLAGGGIADKHEIYMRMFVKQGKKSRILGNQRDLIALRKDGSEFPCKIGIKKVKDTNLLVAYIRDITAEKEAERLTLEIREAEKRAAEQLLLNMLPPEIAQRLKNDPKHIADHFSEATILFADIVGFTSMSNSLLPKEVVHFLNEIFSRFDAKLEKYHLNKVKTIGDCYMVTNVPGQQDTKRSSDGVCHFALDMIQALEEYNKNSDHPLQMRIGINMGPVVAGVVGTKRFLYDIWGDSVNVASRMESTGVPGKVQVTQSVVDNCDNHQLLFEKRGCVQVKGIGMMETFFLTGRTDRKRAFTDTQEAA